jgi:hypothetical protein
MILQLFGRGRYSKRLRLAATFDGLSADQQQPSNHGPEKLGRMSTIKAPALVVAQWESMPGTFDRHRGGCTEVYSEGRFSGDSIGLAASSVGAATAARHQSGGGSAAHAKGVRRHNMISS